MVDTTRDKKPLITYSCYHYYMKKILLSVVLILSLLFVVYANKNEFSRESSESSTLPKLDLSYAECDGDNECIALVGQGREAVSRQKYKVLQKGTGMTFENQVTESNTAYEIRFAFDLNNKTIRLPENCVLIFAGGCLKNGTIVGNNTYLEGSAEYIFDKSLNFGAADKFYVKNISFPKGKDISTVAQRMIDVFNVLELETGTYYLSSPLILKNYYTRIVGAGKNTIITTNKKLDYAIRTVFNSEVKNPGKYYNASIIDISDLKIDGGDAKNFKNGIFLEGPSCTVSNCHITGIESVGVKLSMWCNNLINCIITHCDIGALISEHANAVNVCYNRIENNTANLVVQGFRGVNICNNTLEGASTFNLALGSGISCKIRDNYFEGISNSITNLLKTTENRSLEFSGKKNIKGCIWIGAIDLIENNHITNVSYRIGNKNSPSSVIVEGNHVDIPSERNLLTAASEVYFVLIGSCSVYCAVNNNSIVRPQKAVCGFFDTDNAILENTEILNNFVAHTSKPNNSLELIHDNYSKVGWRAKQHVIGKLLLDSN